MGKYFGTDGVRGVANTSELTCEMALAIGRAAATVLTEHSHKKARIIIGKDTRMSSDMLESALAAGLCSVGADVELLGVVPTPAVAYLVGAYGADAGVMISASHNPVEFNGIKIFNGQGFKLPDAIEAEIEEHIDHPEKLTLKTGTEIGKVHVSTTAVEDYVAHILSTVEERAAAGLKVAIDCANGSASATARKLFTALGASCTIINDRPDGTNINLHCGSTHMEELQRCVVENGCDIGVAFDGDADRCLAVDETGALIDGDKMIAIFAKALKKGGKLKRDTAVITVMTNMGFFEFARKNGIETAVTTVGDRYVLEEMLKEGYNIGGEQSGHIIFLDHVTTGDGQLSASQLLQTLAQSGRRASELASVMAVYPQVLINLEVPSDKKDIAASPAVAAAIAAGESELGESGRILVRASGTEPLVRVMLEGKDSDQIQRIGEAIADAIRGQL